MSKAYYNEIDPNAAEWLRQLIKLGEIADGIVDERSIEDVVPADLMGFTQCHFFAGIGVWALALRRAGWPDDREIWTGSCPCQPFSSAGKGGGSSDSRHLWPSFDWLISVRRPQLVLGEQVANSAGMHWFDHVQSDLEAKGYAAGKVVFPACGIGAPHQRQRTYWMANSVEKRLQGRLSWRQDTGGKDIDGHIGRGGTVDRMEDSIRNGRGEGRNDHSRHGQPQQLDSADDACIMANPSVHGHAAADGLREEIEPSEQTGTKRLGEPSGSGDADGLVDSSGLRRRGWNEPREGKGNEEATGSGSIDGTLADTECEGLEGYGFDGSTVNRSNERIQPWTDDGIVDTEPHAGPTNGFWGDVDWLFCKDGKWRPAKSSIQPLVDGSPSELVCSGDLGTQDVEGTKEARTMRLKGYGNAIVAEQATIFVETVMELI